MDKLTKDLDRLISPIGNSPLSQKQCKSPESPRFIHYSGMRVSKATPNKKVKVLKSRQKVSICDRFIPNRSAMDLDVGHHKLLRSSQAQDQSSSSVYQNILSAALLDKPMPTLTAGENHRIRNELTHSKILAFGSKVPSVHKGYVNPNRILFNQIGSGTRGRRHKFRHIPQQAKKIMDAPNMVDNFYLNVLDWGADNLLAVGLSDSVFVWNAQTGSILELCRTEHPSDIYSAVKWSSDGGLLAIASSGNGIQIWDAGGHQLLRTVRGQATRVGSLSWNQHLLTSGGRDGTIINHDVRIARSVTAQLCGHEQEVCGLAWDSEGRQLASGGNDNIVCLWDTQSPSGTQWLPRLRLTHHTAAVKGLAWCPWQRGLLATGGGSADRYLRFWNSSSGICVAAADTKSQVCSVVWSPSSKELVTSHGFSQHQLTVWRYPSLVRMAELQGHQARVLHTALSPDGQTVASLAGDETLRLWDIFAQPDVGSSSTGNRRGFESCLSSNPFGVCSIR